MLGRHDVIVEPRFHLTSALYSSIGDQQITIMKKYSWPAASGRLFSTWIFIRKQTDISHWYSMTYTSSRYFSVSIKKTFLRPRANRSYCYFYIYILGTFIYGWMFVIAMIYVIVINFKWWFFMGTFICTILSKLILVVIR